MPGPLTFPITTLLKWGIRIVPPIYVLGEQLLDFLHEHDAPMEWRHVQVIQTRGTPAGTIEDKAMITFDVLNVTDGNVDSSWTTDDYVALEARLSTFLTAINSVVHTSASWTEIRHYRRAFADPMLPGRRFEASGPPQRVTAIGIAGAASSSQHAYQVALSVTEKTAWPRHWGRFYIPTLGLGLAASARFSSTTCTTVATAAGALMNGLMDDQLPLVVPSTQADGTLSGYLLAVNSIQVDDVPDVQRRRRPKQPAVRVVVPIS